MTKEEQFNAFWCAYPNKKGKGDARKAFDIAIKKTTLERMLDAITKYVANKPDWQAYKHPGPWLRAERWDDEWEPQQAKASTYNFGGRPIRDEDIIRPATPLSDEERARRAEMAAKARALVGGVKLQEAN
jgi:hypothetical protein